MTIFIFGNPDLSLDSLPLKIASRLKQRLPKIKIEIKNPHEEWGVPDNLIVIDTVLGIKEIKVFDNLNDFILSPRFSLHGFDAFFNLRYLKKLGKLKKIKIIGLPPTITENMAVEQTTAILSTLSSKSERRS